VTVRQKTQISGFISVTKTQFTLEKILDWLAGVLDVSLYLDVIEYLPRHYPKENPVHLNRVAASTPR
jgi:hypothetical protein